MTRRSQMPTTVMMSMVTIAGGVLTLAACSAPTSAPSPSASAPATSFSSSGGSTLSSSSSPSSSTTPSGASPSGTPTSSAPAGCTPAAIAGRLSLDQQVGQVFMVGNRTSGVSPLLAGWAARHAVGNVMLTGRSTAPVGQIAELTSGVRQVTTVSGIRPFIATDQEGGNVQVLKGPDFDRMPTALVQGSWTAATLTARASAWADQLMAAGVNMNLAPVADTAAAGADNPPIGDFDREFGHTAQAAGAGAAAFTKGQLAQGVAVSVKHFPGLGSVTSNTDFSASVLDTVTSEDSPSIGAFRQVIDAGVPFVMVSSATYQKIDPDHLAVFSPKILTWLRDGLGFSGAVITDDLSGAKAPQVLPAGARAITALAAGNDLLLLSAEPQVLPTMWQAVHDRAASDAGFRQQLSDAATRVIAAKQRMGLVTCGS